MIDVIIDKNSQQLRGGEFEYSKRDLTLQCYQFMQKLAIALSTCYNIIDLQEHDHLQNSQKNICNKHQSQWMNQQEKSIIAVKEMHAFFKVRLQKNDTKL